MATGKRYYWIKLKKDFFTLDEIEYLMTNGGSDYVVLYLQLCTTAINTAGRLESQIGEMIVPFNVDRIQREGRYFSRETVEKAIDLYKRIGLVYEDRDGTLIIADYGDMVGSETDWAAKKRRQKSGETGGENFPIESRVKSLESRDKSQDKRVPEASVSVSSCHTPRACDTDTDARLLSGFFYQHGLKVSSIEVSQLITDGFDLDSIFWMLEQTETAHPASPLAYFRSVCDDKREKGLLTIDQIRDAECDSKAFTEMFDKGRDRWRQYYSKYLEGSVS